MKRLLCLLTSHRWSSCGSLTCELSIAWFGRPSGWCRHACERCGAAS